MTQSCVARLSFSGTAPQTVISGAVGSDAGGGALGVCLVLSLVPVDLKLSLQTAEAEELQASSAKPIPATLAPPEDGTLATMASIEEAEWLWVVSPATGAAMPEAFNGGSSGRPLAVQPPPS